MADYIDRDTLIVKFQQLADIEWNKETGTSWANAFFEAVDIIDDMPSADVRENVHGEWEEKKIIVQNERGYVVQARCSKCNRYSTQLVSQPKVIVYDYCPRCGSRMVQDGKAD